ncbi:Fibrobacter succinogenes major domain (Fib_succ_major) [Bacteroides xylanisolvens XB1A]|uniref:Fibrobacter succinogenes major domain (Fib_succ_major) n=1 Tax=Bacteroides xylanisolvens XB1A TaxID=657309 RepID=D6D416_9BACE|nr:FISUMP domain-containing protein [Bacteroides xylanisolvens]CBK69168.1 Fibrobacter succinogenes major domain (Fib_succ_major) [Bacteroides xylanisolvens XB1A]
MKHFKDLFSILCLLFITTAFVACDDDNDEYATDDETILSVPQDDLIFTYEGEAKTINVTASENTFVASVTTGDETWAHVSTANNSVKIVVDENVDQQERSTTLTVKLNDARSRIRVKQDAAPAPEAKPKTFTVPTFTGTDKTFVYKLMDGNTQVGEICREYLCSSGNIDKQAIVVYPIVGNSADLTRGFVVSVLDQVYEEDMPTEVFNVSSEPIHNGSVAFDKSANSISSYIAGTKAAPAQFLSISNSGEIKAVEALSDETLTTAPYYATDASGNNYGIVKIGTQYWMQYNLKTTKLANGSDIATGITGADAWKTTAAYRESSSPENPDAGFLYNAVACGYLSGAFADAISPEGFTIPSNEKWSSLVSYLSGTNTVDVGSKLKVTGFGENWNVWYDYKGGTNISGFSAYGIGYGNGDGTLAPDGIKAHVFYLSSTTYGEGLGRFNLNASESSSLLQTEGGFTLGYAIRCIKY